MFGIEDTINGIRKRIFTVRCMSETAKVWRISRNVHKLYIYCVINVYIYIYIYIYIGIPKVLLQIPTHSKRSRRSSKKQTKISSNPNPREPGIKGRDDRLHR